MSNLRVAHGPTQDPEGAGHLPLNSWARWVPVLLTGLGLWAVPPPDGVEAGSWRLLAIFVATIVGLVARPLPPPAIALISIVVAVFSRTVTLAEAEKLVLDYVRAHVPEAGTAPLAGNSIGTDRQFISRDMPELDNYLHYRMVDVSSIKELCRRWYPRIYFGQPTKGLSHRALAAE